MMKAAASGPGTVRPPVPGIQTWCLDEGNTSAYLAAVKAWAVTEQQGAQALARIDQWARGDRVALLNLSGLSLRSLPPLHPQLRQLDASNNRLTALPEHLPALSVLIVRGNALTCLPEALPVSSLHKLDVVNNHLNCMPSGLHWLRPGCEIQVQGNNDLIEFQAPVGCLLDMTLFILLATGEHKKLSSVLKEFPGAVNMVDAQGNSLLHRAVHTGDLASVSILLANPAIDLNSRDSEGQTALSLACRMGLDHVALLLLSCDGIDADQPDTKGVTPLLWAVNRSSKVVVQALLAKPDVDPHKSDIDGMSPWRCVIQEKNLSMFQCLLASPALDVERPFANGLPPAVYIAALGLTEMLELLLQKAAINQPAQRRLAASALLGACTSNQIRLAGLLLRKYRCSANASEGQHASPLSRAANGGYVDIVRLLLRYGADPNAEVAGTSTVLQAAIAADALACVRVLLAAPGINPNARGIQINVPPLHYAAQKGYATIVAELLKHPATEPDCTDDLGATSLCIAAGLGHEAVAATLLADPRIDVNKADINQQTPLQHACHQKKVAIVRLLLRHPNLRIDCPGEDHLHPLNIAANSGSGEIVHLILTALKKQGRLEDFDQVGFLRQLLRNCSAETVVEVLNTLGIDASHVFPMGMSLMNLSCFEGNAGVVRWLLNHGIDPNKPDAKHVWPLQCAVMNDMPFTHQIIVKLMLAGADVFKIPSAEDRSKTVRRMGDILTQALISAGPAPQTAASGQTRSDLHKPDDPLAAIHSLFEDMSALPADQQAVLLAGVLLHSVSEFDRCLAEHPALMRFLRMEFLAGHSSKAALLERVHQKIQRWDGQGFDGAGRGSFSVLKTERSRLTLLTREIFQIWTGIAPEVFRDKS